MLPFWFEMLLGLVGFGILSIALRRWLKNRQWLTVVSIIVLVVLIWIQHSYFDYKRAPRHLEPKPAVALVEALRKVKDPIDILVHYTPNNTEASDYAHEFMLVFATAKLHAGFGYDISPGQVIVRQGKVIVPFKEEEWPRFSGLVIFVPDLSKKPTGAIQLVEAFNAAGFSPIWRTNIRLDKVQRDFNGPLVDQCLFFVGQKSEISFSSWVFRFYWARYLFFGSDCCNTNTT